MIKNRTKNTKAKFCPFLDKHCIQKECAIYHGKFEKCEIDILTYNLWLVSEKLKPEAID